jgi:hypothetical protein
LIAVIAALHGTIVTGVVVRQYLIESGEPDIG